MKLLSLLAALIALPALAQDYPGKPIRMVVGFPPGGGTDVVARIITPRYSELLGQSVVIENRPGATGTLAAGQVAKSPPDGYTIMMGHVSVNAIAPALFSNLSYDVIKDFAPIGIAAAVPHFVTVHPSVPAQSLKELIEFLKSKPELTFPSAGNGSTPHLAGEIFGSLAGVKLVHVPYKGSGQSMQDLLGGQHLVAFDTMPASAPHVRSGKLRALATSSAARLPAFPDVPTAQEAGLAGLPGHDLVRRVRARRHAARDREPAPLRSRQSYADARREGEARRHRRRRHGFRSPAEFAALVRADTARYAKIVKEIGLKMD